VTLLADITRLCGSKPCDGSHEHIASCRDLERAWDTCERGDHLLWVAGRLDVDRRKIVMAACRCARLVLHLAAGPEAGVAVLTAERWCRGEATVPEVRAAADAAAAAYAAAAADAADAAYAAAAAAAYAAAYAAADAAAAAAAAYAAADAAAAAAAYAAAARQATHRHCAARVREVIPWSVIANAIKRKGIS